MVFPSGEMALKRIHNGLVWAVEARASKAAASTASLLLILIFKIRLGYFLQIYIKIFGNQRIFVS